MVAPVAGKLKSIVDEIADRLDTVDGLRVYKYPADSVQEFPAAIIRDNQATLAEYRSTTPEAVYHLEVMVVVGLAEEQEAYEELEKYVSGASVNSVQSLECVRAEPRRRYAIGGASLWGCAFWVRNIVT